MKSPLRLFNVITGILLLVSTSAVAQSTNVANLVFRDRIEPRWFAGADGKTNKFWYRVDTGRDENEFVLVDAATGKRGPAFDHARVAEAMSKVTGSNADAKKLPIDDIEFATDGKSVTIRRGTSSWKLDLSTYTLEKSSAATEENRLPVGRTARPSINTGPETQLILVNRFGQDVEVFWIDSDGKRMPYGLMRDGERREQHTFAGHMWLVQSTRGTLLGVFEAEAKPGLAVIEAPQGQAQRGRGGRGGGGATRPAGQRSPDGRWEILVQGHNLVLRDTRAAEKDRDTKLTHDGNPSSSYARNADADRSVSMNFDSRDPETPVPEVYWSPDSKHFVAMRLQAGTQRSVYLVVSSPEDQLQPKLDSYPYLKPGDQLPIRKPRLFDVEAKQEISVNDALFSNPWSIGELRWHSNSTHFTFLYNQRGHQVLRILSVDSQSGSVKPIVDEYSKTFIDYSGKMFSEYLEANNEIIWASERDGWNHLYLYDSNMGRVKNQITKGEWLVRSIDRVDREKRQIWFQAGGIRPGQDPYYVHYCRVNFDGSGLTILTEGDGTHTAQFSPDREYFLDTWSRVDKAPVTELRSSADGKLVCKLEEAEAGELLATGWQMPEKFVAKARDGVTDIHGVIWRPKGFDAQKKYPVIENIYAGPQGFFTPKNFRASYQHQRLADRGFVVVQMDGMGTSSRSKAFHDVCWKNIKDAGFPDRILWHKAAAAKYPFMDLTRVGLYGTSAGGQNSLRGMLDHPDFYKACVSDCGCHDNRMDKVWWNEQWMGWPLDDSYVKSSNMEDAHKLQGKLLLMVGEVDRNVDPASTMQVVNALIKADKDFDLLVSPNVGHGVARTPYGARRLEEFFVKAFLGPEAKTGNGGPASNVTAP
jgi:dipeptidyl-peptidase-4